MSPNRALALLASGLLGGGAAVLSSCAGSSKLIPLANSEPLKNDFQEVQSAAENAHGSCSATEAALTKAQSDLSGLPASVDAALRRRLSEGLTKLRTDALEACGQPAAGTTAATTAPPATTPTNTQATTPTTTKTSTTPGGASQAKEEKEREKEEEKEKEKEGEAGGTKPKEKGGDGSGSPGNSVLPNGGQEGGK